MFIYIEWIYFFDLIVSIVRLRSSLMFIYEILLLAS